MERPADRLQGLPGALEHRAEGEYSRWRTVFHDAAGRVLHPILARGVDGHRDDLRVEAPEVRDDEVQTLREEQQRSVTRFAAPTQLPGHGKRPCVQLAVGQHRFLLPMFSQEHVRPVGRLGGGAALEDLREQWSVPHHSPSIGRRNPDGSGSSETGRCFRPRTMKLWSCQSSSSVRSSRRCGRR